MGGGQRDAPCCGSRPLKEETTAVMKFSGTALGAGRTSLIERGCNATR
jgi:hypothetical protein